LSLAVRLLALLAALSVAGCGGIGEDRRAPAEAAARAAGLAPILVPAARFTLRAWVPAAPRPAQRLAVFIEGDGRAWLSRTRPSDDPTPRRPVALELAARSAQPLVAYLARPCQELPAGARGNCEVRYWTGHRFAPEVAAALDEALDTLKQRLGARRLLLVGYSGGGNLALLLGARRSDVDGVLTVAGVLDHAAWTALHGVTPLVGSLNAADAEGIARLPQAHVAGADDREVPPVLAQRYVARFPPASRPALLVEPGADHGCCWAERWPALEPRLLQALGRP